MYSKLVILTICLIAAMFLAGCGDGSDFFGFGGSSGGDNFTISSLLGGSGSGNGGSGSGNGGSGSGSGSSNPGGGVTHPEPATLALLGSGLLAYALLRRKKRK